MQLPQSMPSPTGTSKGAPQQAQKGEVIKWICPQQAAQRVRASPTGASQLRHKGGSRKSRVLDTARRRGDREDIKDM